MAVIICIPPFYFDLFSGWAGEKGKGRQEWLIWTQGSLNLILFWGDIVCLYWQYCWFAIWGSSWIERTKWRARDERTNRKHFHYPLFVSFCLSSLHAKHERFLFNLQTVIFFYFQGGKGNPGRRGDDGKNGEKVPSHMFCPVFERLISDQSILCCVCECGN